MSAKRIVERCRLCGAPLKDPTRAVITCRFCEADNRLDLSGFQTDQVELQLRVERAQRAAREAQDMAPEIERMAEELNVRMMEQISVLRTSSDSAAQRAARAEAVRLFEAYFRLHQMPGLHIAQAAGCAGEEMFERVDEATAKAVAEFDAGLDP